MYLFAESRPKTAKYILFLCDQVPYEVMGVGYDMKESGEGEEFSAHVNSHFFFKSDLLSLLVLGVCAEIRK